MTNALRIAATGMAAQQTRVDTIANNIANMSTTAYAPRRAAFADLLYKQELTPGAVSSRTGTLVPGGIQLGLGVRTAAVTQDRVQGTLTATGGDLDIAIEGRGYFDVELPSGETAYTRDGRLSLDPQGVLVNAEGFPVAGGITVPSDARQVTIATDGEVYAVFSDGSSPQAIGTIGLTVFANEKGLEALGGNLFRETEASGAPLGGVAGLEGAGFMRQGYLEDSGVDVVSEIADLIEAQRGYDLNSKVLTAADEMYAAATRIR
ncbi:flagellar basal-body rod protein FlgG [Parvularcula dongshanensis]|uniref:Flagellar basal-body rod protein FlgG n=1 Tax=Parvularcula dongshanensis TaxID=1173995 RepID=A0A840I876_9PROT|nr:flagellar basal-body rod protein FlgG [Parvularcula dongshanensis]MBB4660308.1 flagellar basal-body rod protein FlgG [Parvularcula dongshanensis]